MSRTPARASYRAGIAASLIAETAFVAVMMGLMDAAIRGALGGVAGGLAMYAMKQMVAPKVLPEEMHRQEFAPKAAVEWAERQAGNTNALTENQENKAAMAAHLAYSALYGLARRKADGVPTPLAGALFGLVVWGVSFEGLMPALGMMPATTDLPMKK